MENINIASSSGSNSGRPTMTARNAPSNSFMTMVPCGANGWIDSRNVPFHGWRWLPPINTYYPPPPPPPFSYYPPPHTSFIELNHKILKQIEFYFSDDNLAKDIFLRSNMDTEGWVFATVIASFRRISVLTNSIQVIFDSLKYSNIVEVEVQNGKMRRRGSWKKWLLPPREQGSCKLRGV